MHAPWNVVGEVGRNSGVRRFADAVWPEDTEEALTLALADLAACGHRDGIVRMDAVRVELVDSEAVHLRCTNCGRVHLHEGVGVCTRCFQPFEWSKQYTEKVGVLHSRNFLSRRLHRDSDHGADASAGFRLHCEELTGQTEDPATRQREFRGIFLPRMSSIDPRADGDDDTPELLLDAPDPILRRKDEIDLLAVTTTMEVGIDIGPLQVVQQANMPPQRFNYQQRVGRAGRRGQAFSMALTICRTKSHDLFYFRKPKKITGDIPPTPVPYQENGQHSGTLPA